MEGDLVKVVDVVVCAVLFDDEHLLPQLQDLIQLSAVQLSKFVPLPFELRIGNLWTPFIHRASLQ